MSGVNTETGEVVEAPLTTELATITPAEINRRDITDGMVTQALVECCQWLDVAMKGTDPTPIAHLKAWAATVEEATKQKRLGRDVEIKAAEIVRRAERGIGVAIRNGQEAGEIAKRGQGAAVPPGARDRRDSGISLPSDFASHGELTGNKAGIYDLADDVSDEDFDAAIDEAKAEGNLSRANVVRKVKGQSGPQTRNARANLIADLAAEGYSSRQMPERVGVSEETVRAIARDYAIEIPADKAVLRTRRLDSNRIVREVVAGLEGTRMSLELISYDDLDLRETRHWATSLDDSLKALQAFRKQIREMTQ